VLEGSRKKGKKKVVQGGDDSGVRPESQKKNHGVGSFVNAENKRGKR